MNNAVGTVSVLHALMAERRSVRKFTSKMPAKQMIEDIVAAAVTAPSASNKQPWRFCIITDRARIEAMRAAVQAALDHVVSALDDDLDRREIQEYGRYFVRFVDAPIVIAPLYRPMAVLSHLLGAWNQRTDGAELHQRVRRLEERSGVVSTSLAIQNLLLSAHAAGLGASCMTGPLLAAGEIERMLGIGGDWTLCCLIALGYADEVPVPPKRKSAATIMRWYD